MSDFKARFVVACDMDDVLMTPHSYIAFSQYLGVFDVFTEPLRAYKRGELTYEKLWQAWHEIVSRFSPEDRTNAISHTVETIPRDAADFVRRAGDLGEFIIVSGNDGDLVEAISQRLGVRFVAVNKFIFGYRLVTNRKSEALRAVHITPSVVITDDPINENDFLNMASHGIVVKRRDTPLDFRQVPTEHYLVVDTLHEVYDNLVLIKNEQKW